MRKRQLDKKRKVQKQKGFLLLFLDAIVKCRRNAKEGKGKNIIHSKRDQVEGRRGIRYIPK